MRIRIQHFKICLDPYQDLKAFLLTKLANNMALHLIHKFFDNTMYTVHVSSNRKNIKKQIFLIFKIGFLKG